MTNTLKQLYLFSWTVLAEARSSKTIISVSIIYLLAMTIALFAGEISITESEQTQASITAGFLRFVIIFFLSLFTINSIVRDINDRMLLLYLSLPISRSVFILGKFIGFACIAAILALLAALLVSMYADFHASALWGVSLMLESWLMIGFSLLCAFSFSQITLAFSSVALIYLLSRTIATILLIAKNPFRGINDSVSQQFSEVLLTVLDYLLPRLDRFTRTEWVIYEKAAPVDIYFILQQSAIYLLLLLSATFIDFYRKSL